MRHPLSSACPPLPCSLIVSRRGIWRSVDAHEALRMGLVNFVLPKAELDAHVHGAPPCVRARMCARVHVRIVSVRVRVWPWH